MRKLVRILNSAALLLAFAIVASAHHDWKGSYYFGEDGGKNAGGIAVLISHELTIYDGDTGLAATLESNGYQTSSELICTTRIEGTKLLIIFNSYGENNMFEPYKPGDVLLSLERRITKGKPEILTHWGKFTPAIPRNSKSGKVYFEKTTDNKKI